jgi:hypothetical protein
LKKTTAMKNIDIVPDKEGFSVFGGIRITIVPHTEETHKFNRTDHRRHVAELPNWDLEPHCLLPFLLWVLNSPLVLA